MIRGFANLDGAVFNILDEAAELEKSTHRYTSRSGRLESQTYARVFAASQDRVDVDLVMNTPYANVIKAKKLSNIEEAWNIAIAIIDASFRDID